jgi:hypothetical protein
MIANANHSKTQKICSQRLIAKVQLIFFFQDSKHFTYLIFLQLLLMPFLLNLFFLLSFWANYCDGYSSFVETNIEYYFHLVLTHNFIRLDAELALIQSGEIFFN